MSSASQLQELRLQRERELALLRSRVAAIAQRMPAQWVDKHPYIATASAAMAGFAAAQIPCGPSREPPAKPAPAAPAPAAAPAVPSLSRGELLDLLVTFALQFLQPAIEAPPVSIAVADAGAVAGADFPPFPCTAPLSA